MFDKSCKKSSTSADFGKHLNMATKAAFGNSFELDPVSFGKTGRISEHFHRSHFKSNF
jgi:hypothetical protein